MAKYYVLYHSPCPDGCFAALAAALWFEGSGIDPLGGRVKWQPMDVARDPNAQFAVDGVGAEDEVFLLDYSGGAPFVLSIAKCGCTCTVLDHHETALKELRAALQDVAQPKNLTLVLDMHRSGATIALDYFSARPFPARSPEGEPPAKVPRLAASSRGIPDYGRLFRDTAEAKRLLRVFRLIEDGDVWRWWLEGSRDFAAGFAGLKLDMNPASHPALFETLRTLKPEELMAKGAEARQVTDKVIVSEVENTFELLIPQACGCRCLGVVTERGDLRSSMGHAIALKSKSLGLRGFGCVIYNTAGLPEGKIKCSVRAVEDENSLELTEKFGGGGHKGASSCNIDVAALEAWRVARPS